MKKSNKILALLLAIVMIFGAIPNTVFALEGGENVSYVAKIGDDEFETLQAAMNAASDANMEHIVVDLCADAVYDVAAWSQNGLGSENAQTITINGDGHKLTFNNTNTDWNNVTTKNGATLTLNNMTIDNSGYDSDKGTWNAYDINFACYVAMNNVTALNALAFKAGANLENVKIIDNGLSAAYAIWIRANGQTVTLNNCEIDSTANVDGRGIKIDEQYLNDGEKSKVTLSVSNTSFATDSKPAILVKSSEGADITIDNIDISNVPADTVNAVWIDEDSAAYADKVSVTGANMIVEGAPIASKLKTNIGELEFVVGIPTEFEFSTIANDDAGVMVVGSSNFSDLDAIEKLEYYEVQNGEWYELSGDFGPATGFPMSDATSKFRVTFAKAGEYTFTAVMKKADSEDILCSVEATANVAEYEPSELLTDIDELEFVVGEPQEFTFSTVANHDAGTMVVGSSNFSDPDAIERLEYYEVQNGEWYELSGDFGPATGFPMSDATSKFRVTFAKAGEYAFTSVMKKVGTDEVLCSVEATAKVAEAPAVEEPEDEKIILTSIDFEIDNPAIGKAPSAIMDVTTDPDFDINMDDIHYEWYINAASNDIEDKNWIEMEKEAVFEKDAYYGFVVEYSMPEGVIADNEIAITINGAEVDDTIVENDDASCITAVIVYDKLIEDEEKPGEGETPENPDVPKDPETPDTPKDPSDKPEEKKEYTVTEGANGEWKDNSKEGMSFKSDAAFADFDSLKIDGEVVDAKNYTVKEGSTIVTLNADFLKTLKAGEHTIAIVSKDGEAATKFNVVHEHVLTKVEAKAETCTEKGNKEYYACDCGKFFEDEKAEKEIADKTAVEIKAAGHKASENWTRSHKEHWHKCTVCGEIADEKVEHKFDDTGKICKDCKYDVDKPQTGDEFNIGTMIAMMAFSVVGIVGVLGYNIYDKKHIF